MKVIDIMNSLDQIWSDGKFYNKLDYKIVDMDFASLYPNAGPVFDIKRLKAVRRIRKIKKIFNV